MVGQKIVVKINGVSKGKKKKTQSKKEPQDVEETFSKS